MSEQRTGVETFDPDIALQLVREKLYQIDAELWGERFRVAAFGGYSALNGELPPDASAYEEAVLEQTLNFVVAQLSQFKQGNLAAFVVDPGEGSWYRITGVGHNKGLLSLVAQVYDPHNSVGIATRLLGPSTSLAYTPIDPGERKMPGWQNRIGMWQPEPPSLQAVPTLIPDATNKLPFNP